MSMLFLNDISFAAIQRNTFLLHLFVKLIHRLHFSFDFFPGFEEFINKNVLTSAKVPKTVVCID